MHHYTVREVAEKTRISRQTVIRALKSGRLKGFKTSPGRTGQWRISGESVTAYVNGDQASV